MTSSAAAMLYPQQRQQQSASTLTPYGCHVATNIEDLAFPDDFAEFKARADSGGSTYGLLRRQAFAQRSFRIGGASGAGHGARSRGDSGNADGGGKTSARRSKSLVPTTSTSRTSGRSSLFDTERPTGAAGPSDRSAAVRETAATATGRGAPDTLLPAVDSKALFKSFCERTQYHNQQLASRQHSSGSRMDTLQVPGVEFRRHSMKEERRRWSNSSTAGDDLLGLPPGAPGGLIGGACRRRSFSVTPKGGLVNEGDEVLPVSLITTAAAGTFALGGTDPSDFLASADGNEALYYPAVSAAVTERRRSSAVPVSGAAAAACRRTSCDGGENEPEKRQNDTAAAAAADDDDEADTVFRVMVLGGPGVGKTAITQQFLTSEYMAAQNTSFDDGRQLTVPVLLNGCESVMEFIDLPYSGDPDEWRDYDVDGFIVVYSIIDRRSYQKACDVINAIRDQHSSDVSSVCPKPVLLVANKNDLERSRMIGKEEGKSLALNNSAKYIEVSAILNHKIDDLLVEILKQIRASQSTPSTPSGTGQQNSLSSSSAGTALTSWLRRHSSVNDRNNSSSSSSNSPSSTRNTIAKTSGEDSPRSSKHRKSAAAAGSSVECDSICGDDNSTKTSCSPLSIGCLSPQSSGGGSGLRAYVAGGVARLRRVGSPLGAKSGRRRGGDGSSSTGKTALATT